MGFRNRDHSSFHRMDDFLHCFHNPSNHIRHSSHHYHHSSHRSTSTNHLHVGCLMSIRNLRSIRCSHCRIQVHHMGIHIHNRCMGCIHQSSLSLQCCLHSQRTNRSAIVTIVVSTIQVTISSTVIITITTVVIVVQVQTISTWG